MLDDVQEEKQGTPFYSFAPHHIILILRAEPQPHTRSLGLAVLRGPTITILSPVDGSEVRVTCFFASFNRMSLLFFANRKLKIRSPSKDDIAGIHAMFPRQIELHRHVYVNLLCRSSFVIR